MGLDMFAYRMKDFKPQNPLQMEGEIEKMREEGIEPEEFFYWRKHPNLHGLMEKIYREKGGQGESFNCVAVMLTLEDLTRIRQEVEAQTLPMTEGFFFGESQKEEKERDLEFLKEAEKSLKDGFTIWYDSWW